MNQPLPDSAPHILVVDDDSRLRDLLAQFLGRNGYRVSLAADAAEARTRLASLSFDLLIVDVMMPGESGTEFLGDLRRTDQVPVLMLTALGESEDRIHGLENGADDYLTKPFEPRELLLRLNAILRRATAPAAAAQVIRFGDYSFDLNRGELIHDGRPVSLTSAETALLRTLARNPGVTVPRADLLAATGSGEGRAVDVTVTRLRRKIEKDPKSPRFLQTVWGEGYVLWPD
jgi:two-component system phosphate regulon response regulator OmpR